MNTKNDSQQLPTWQEVASYPFVKGSAIGTTVLAMVTPGLKWTNHALKDEAMQWRNCMSGASEYAASAAPTYAVVLTVKALLKRPSEETSVLYELFTSFVAGALSGFTSTPFEAVAQNKQMANLSSSTDTRQKMIQHNGYSCLTRGAGSIMLREGCWSAVYLTAISAVSKYWSSKGLEENQAKGLAVVTTAGTYGLLTSPLYQLRYRKQQGLTEVSANKSYTEHANDIWNQNPKASPIQRVGFFFKGWKPRTATSAAAALLLVEGMEQYDNLVKPSNRN